MAKGKFIVLYGINNLGKTTQAKLLVEKLKAQGRRVKYLKYPVYEIKPSGPLLDEYLRKENPKFWTPLEAQLIYAFNRAQYEPQLIKDLESGIDIVAEDYWGTGVAWGMAQGIEKQVLLEINSGFYPPDLCLLFVGRRFTSGIEANHLHERQEELTKKADAAHGELGQELGWKEVNANASIEEVSQKVWEEWKRIM